MVEHHNSGEAIKWEVKSRWWENKPDLKSSTKKIHFPQFKFAKNKQILYFDRTAEMNSTFLLQKVLLSLRKENIGGQICNEG